MRTAIPSCLLIAALAAGCDGADAPDDVTGHPRAEEIARIEPAEAALANAPVATLDPHTMNDAEIRLALGAGPRCVFRYTSAGKPVLAVAAPPEGPPIGGVVKLNGSLVRLVATPEAGVAARSLHLAAGAVRLTLTPDAGPGALDAEAPLRRPADLVFEVGDELRVGYRGYLGCAARQPG